MDDWKDRDESAIKIMRKAIGKIVTVPQTLAFPISPQSIRTSNYNKPVQMTLLGNSYEQLEKWQNLIMMEIRKNKNLAAIESDYSKNKPVIKLIINASTISLFIPLILLSRQLMGWKYILRRLLSEKIEYEKSNF